MGLSEFKVTEETLRSLVFTVDVEDTISKLLAQEDTDGDGKITIYDKGPKAFILTADHPSGTLLKQITGTYKLATLLEELTLASDRGETTAHIPYAKIIENPVEKISARINDVFWDNLTRRLDSSLIFKAAQEQKETISKAKLRIYVPSEEEDQISYYTSLAREQPNLGLEVIKLPKAPFSPKFVQDLNTKPGILALEMKKTDDASPGDSLAMRGSTFVVPGGRFNELYYWDSYFICIGLLEAGKTAIVEELIENFNFQIRHYGKVLNANRSYYLGRTQPPFLTDLARRTYERTKDQPDAKQRLRTNIWHAIKEYSEVWMAEPRYDPETGLSRYRPIEQGFPPEVGKGLFDHILGPLAEARGMSIQDYIQSYDSGQIKEPKLDEYLLHDRAVRESGHDVSYRVDGRAGNLATIDLNCLLYKYETDIAWAISTAFSSHLDLSSLPALSPAATTSSFWLEKARLRAASINTHLWSPAQNLYFDYDTATRTQSTYESVTAFYALWAGVASPAQAAALVSHALPRFESLGGLASTTAASRGPVTPQRPQRQWDYPYGWAPHQMLAWDGLQRYGFEAEAARLAFRWLHMVTNVAVGVNGAIVEKYDVTSLDGAHMVDAEYGNQGLDFRGVAKEGFGWTNASYVYGLSKLSDEMKSALALGFRLEGPGGSESHL